MTAVMTMLGQKLPRAQITSRAHTQVIQHSSAGVRKRHSLIDVVDRSRRVRHLPIALRRLTGAQQPAPGGAVARCALAFLSAPLLFGSTRRPRCTFADCCLLRRWELDPSSFALSSSCTNVDLATVCGFHSNGAPSDVLAVCLGGDTCTSGIICWGSLRFY